MQSMPAGSVATRTIRTVLPMDALSMHGEDIWGISGSAGEVTEFDATTGRMTNMISGLGDAQGIADDGSDVWVSASPGTVQEIDAATGALLGTPISAGGYPGALSSDGTHVWVVDGGNNAVSEIDAATQTVVRTIQNVPYPTAIDSDGTDVWVTDPYADSVTEINAATGSIVATIPVGSYPDSVASDGSHVWVTNINSDSVSEIDPATSQVVNTINLGNGEYPYSVFDDGSSLWITTGAQTLVQLSASNGQLLNSFSQFQSGQAVVSDGVRTWVDGYGASSLVELTTTVGGVSIGPTSTEANASAPWTGAFTPSLSGSLDGSNQDYFSVRLPASFGISSSPQVQLGSGFVGSCADPVVTSPASNTVAVTLPSGCSLSAGVEGAFTLGGITNPSLGQFPGSDFQILTSQDFGWSSASSTVTITPVTTLLAGESLSPGDTLTSSNSLYTATFQPNGNLVVRGPSGALWSTRTTGSNAGARGHPREQRCAQGPDGGQPRQLDERDARRAWLEGRHAEQRRARAVHRMGQSPLEQHRRQAAGSGAGASRWVRHRRGGVHATDGDLD